MNNLINTLRLSQNGRHFPNDIFKCIILNENVWISLRISLQFFPEVRINNIPASVLIMAWHRPGDKALSEPMRVSLSTHIGVTRPQWETLTNMQTTMLCIAKQMQNRDYGNNTFFRLELNDHQQINHYVFYPIQVNIERTRWEDIRNSPHQTVYLSVLIMQMITLDDVIALLGVFDFVWWFIPYIRLL